MIVDSRHDHHDNQNHYKSFFTRSWMTWSGRTAAYAAMMKLSFYPTDISKRCYSPIQCTETIFHKIFWISDLSFGAQKFWISFWWETFRSLKCAGILYPPLGFLSFSIGFLPHQIFELRQDSSLAFSSLLVVEVGQSSLFVGAVDLVFLPQTHSFHPPMSANDRRVGRLGYTLWSE